MEKNNDYIDKIILQLGKRNTISPFLFVGDNLDLLNENIFSISKFICSKYNIPFFNIYRFIDNGEKIKIGNIKEFLSQSNIGSPYKFQIFLIENISRMTLQAANSCLKVFEEPGKGNIIFLTNKSETGVLDTIISRVQVEKMTFIALNHNNEYFYDLIDGILYKRNYDLIKYFFSRKMEKIEYISFLNTMMYYLKKNMIFLDLLNELSEDIYSLEKNSVNAKYLVDKYILKIIK